MDAVRDLIRKKIDEKGLDLADLSRHVGKNHAYIHQFLNRGSPRVLPEDVRERLAPRLGLIPDDLRPKGAQSLPSAPAIPNFFAASKGGPDRMPVLGTAEGGDDGSFSWNGDIVDFTPRPAYLMGAPQAYAIYVAGASMAPRYEPGELLYVHPGRPVTIGCYVLVQLTPRAEGEPPRAFLKRLAKKTGTKMVLEQFNPAKTFDVQSKDVVSVHRIVGSGDY